MARIRFELIILGLMIPIILVGFALRGHQLQQYPPGLTNDEAINAVDALHIARTGNFPTYEEDEGRAEPLFRIIEAIGINLFGRSVWSLRLTSVLISLPLIAIGFWIIRELLADYPRPVRLAGALAGAIVIATMAGHVTLSRTLYRGTLQLITMGFSIGFVVRGLRTNHWRDYVLSGVFGGLTLYTYTAAWFFPPAFIILGLALLVTRWKAWRQWLPKLMILGIVAGLIALPIVYLLTVNPRAVLGRADALTPTSRDWPSAVQMMIDQFIRVGDENPQYNVDFAPIVPEMMLWLFYAGLLAMLVRIRLAGTWFVLALVILMALPALLSNEITHGLRIAGTYPIVAIIVGIGTAFLVWVGQRLTRQPVLAGSIAVIILLGIGAANSIWTWQRYTGFFDDPGRGRLWDVHDMRLDHNEWFFRVDRQDFGQWLAEQPTPLLVPVEELNRQTTRSWIMDQYPVTRSAGVTVSIPATTRLVVPWSLERGTLLDTQRDYALLQEGVITLLPPLSITSHRDLLGTIEAGEPIMRDGQIDFLGYVQAIDPMIVAFDSPQQQSQPLAEFGSGDITLTAWQGETVINPDSTYTFALTWQANRRIGHEYVASLQLHTQDYGNLGGSDSHILRWIYPTSIWEQDTPVTTMHQLAIPETLEAGAYRLTLGLFYASYPLIPATSQSNPVQDNRLTVGWLKVPQDDFDIPETAYDVDVTIGGMFDLRQIELGTVEDSQLLAHLYWESISDRPDVDATIFVHIINEAGEIVAQSDIRPWNGQYPTFIWDAGEIVRTSHRFNFSDLERAEDYRIRVGMYTFPGPVNLPAQVADQQIDDGLVILGALSDYVTD